MGGLCKDPLLACLNLIHICTLEASVIDHDWLVISQIMLVGKVNTNVLHLDECGNKLGMVIILHCEENKIQPKKSFEWRGIFNSKGTFFSRTCAGIYIQLYCYCFTFVCNYILDRLAFFEKTWCRLLLIMVLLGRHTHKRELINKSQVYHSELVS